MFLPNRLERRVGLAQSLNMGSLRTSRLLQVNFGLVNRKGSRVSGNLLTKQAFSKFFVEGTCLLRDPRGNSFRLKGRFVLTFWLDHGGAVATRPITGFYLYLRSTYSLSSYVSQSLEAGFLKFCFYR